MLAAMASRSGDFSDRITPRHRHVGRRTAERSLAGSLARALPPLEAQGDLRQQLTASLPDLHTLREMASRSDPLGPRQMQRMKQQQEAAMAESQTAMKRERELEARMRARAVARRQATKVREEAEAEAAAHPYDSGEEEERATRGGGGAGELLGRGVGEGMVEQAPRVDVGDFAAKRAAQLARAKALREENAGVGVTLGTLGARKPGIGQDSLNTGLRGAEWGGAAHGGGSSAGDRAKRHRARRRDAAREAASRGQGAQTAGKAPAARGGGGSDDVDHRAKIAACRASLALDPGDAEAKLELAEALQQQQQRRQQRQKEQRRRRPQDEPGPRNPEEAAEGVKARRDGRQPQSGVKPASSPPPPRPAPLATADGAPAQPGQQPLPPEPRQRARRRERRRERRRRQAAERAEGVAGWEEAPPPRKVVAGGTSTATATSTSTASPPRGTGHGGGRPQAGAVVAARAATDGGGRLSTVQELAAAWCVRRCGADARAHATAVSARLTADTPDAWRR
jgi:hypothetical protein